MRIEDIDSPRVKQGAASQTLDDLRWLGFDWDWGPDVGGPHASYIQSQRSARYREVLQQLIDSRVVYRCTCSRREATEAASAPHESALTNLAPLDGTIYPGTCRPSGGECQASANDRDFVWRWRFDPGEIAWQDHVLGAQKANPQLQLGDFVVAKGDGTPAYQLAVVVDDFDMGVTEVVRGSDLVPSTYRQLALLRHLQWPVPEYAHVPLMVGPDGRRLAKRHGDTRLSYFRGRGIAAETLIGYLAWTLAIVDRPQPHAPVDLLGRLNWGEPVRGANLF